MSWRSIDGLPGAAMAALADTPVAERTRVDLAVIEPGASLPRHPAGRAQTFAVVTGTGRVAGPDDVPVPIGPGWVATWQAGEEHTAWADTAMTVLIVQRTPLAQPEALTEPEV